MNKVAQPGEALIVPHGISWEDYFRNQVAKSVYHEISIPLVFLDVGRKLPMLTSEKGLILQLIKQNQLST